MECPICLNIIKDQKSSTTECNHTFCTVCLLKAFNANESCPICRQNLIVDEENEDDETVYEDIDDEEELRLTNIYYQRIEEGVLQFQGINNIHIVDHISDKMDKLKGNISNNTISKIRNDISILFDILQVMANLRRTA